MRRLGNIRHLCSKRRLRRLVIVCVAFCLLINFIMILSERSSSRPVQPKITTSTDQRIHTKLLRNTTCPMKLRLLILVSSNLGNFERRNLIRNTWGPDNSLFYRWRTVFLLTDNGNEKVKGIALREEALYGDAIIGDYKESFFNMAFKVAMGFEWALKFCQFDFLLKTDDDIFVNTLGILDYLNAASRKKLYTGNPMIGSPVLREGRYAVKYATGEKRDDHLNKTVFAPYCSGGGFLLSADVVATILDLYDLQHPLNIDDAYIGELAERAHIKMLVNTKNFLMYADKCKYNTEAFVQHPAQGKCLKELHRQHVKYIMTGELETPPPTKPPTPPPTKPPGNSSMLTSISKSNTAIERLFKSSSPSSSVPSIKPTDILFKKQGLEPSIKHGVGPSDRPSIKQGVGPSDRPSSKQAVGPSNRPSSKKVTGPSDRPSKQGVGSSDRPSSKQGVGPSNRPNKQGVGLSDRPSRQGVGPSNRPSSKLGVVPSDRSSKQGVGPSDRPSRQGVGPSDRRSSKQGVSPSDRPSIKQRVGPSDRPSSK